MTTGGQPAVPAGEDSTARTYEVELARLSQLLSVPSVGPERVMPFIIRIQERLRLALEILQANPLSRLHWTIRGIDTLLTANGSDARHRPFALLRHDQFSCHRPGPSRPGRGFLPRRRIRPPDWPRRRSLTAGAPRRT
ncbi:MAG TPA: hypothetical protein VGL40_09895 [Bacillota bacterium]